MTDVSFTVEPGEVMGLVGSNGAGKTTTTLSAAGLLRPTRGSIRRFGSDAHGTREIQSRIGFAPQEISLYPSLTVRDNLGFFGKLYGLSSSRLGASIASIVHQLDMSDISNRPVRTLSGGQQRLAHVAAALVHEPALLLLDEPSAGLDPAARSNLLQAVRGVAERGYAVLFSSHYLNEVETLCDTVTILHEGRMITSSPMSSLIDEKGSGWIEIVSSQGITRYNGEDVQGALSQHSSEILSITVTPKSLEAVFVNLTGSHISDLEAD